MCEGLCKCENKCDHVCGCLVHGRGQDNHCQRARKASLLHKQSLCRAGPPVPWMQAVGKTLSQRGGH